MTVESPPAKDANSVVKQLKPYDYKIGGTDNDNLPIRKIYSKLLGYTVYRTDNAIRIDIDDDHEHCDTFSKNHQMLSVDLARIYSWLPEELSGSESINRLVGRAITTNASGNNEAAKAILAQAETRIIKLKTIEGRLQYTLSAFTLVFTVFILSLFFWHSKCSCIT